VEAHPLLDEVIRYDAQSLPALIRLLRHKRYDTVIDLMGTPKTAFISFLTGAGMRIGFNLRARRIFYTHAINRTDAPVYSALEKGAMLGPLGVPVQDLAVDLYITPGDHEEAEALIRQLGLKAKGKLIAFSPVSRRAYKRWPPSFYAKACDALFEKYRLAYLPLFGPGEEGMVSEVIAASKHPEAFVFPYKPPSFRALKSLCRECALYFGNDNGIRHIAISAGLPTATIFGRPDPAHWTPPHDARHRHLWGKEETEKIPPEEVIRMAEQVFNEALAV
jgi:ADP-heptose:LPS heptosyltransferase